METAVLFLVAGVIGYAAMRRSLRTTHRQHLPDIAPPRTLVLASRADADIVYLSKEQ